MSGLIELISLLRSLNVKMWVEGDNLRLNAPANTITPEIRQQLLQYKPELIAFLREATPPVFNTRARIKNVHPQELYPLSFAQERLWFMAQMEPESPMYNVLQAFRLQGPVNFSALKQSFSQIIARHESLRTIFTTQNGAPLQKVLPPYSFILKPVKPADWNSWLATESNRPFDLETAPLLRAALLELAKDEHILFINMHHVTTDGWSITVFLRELSFIYNNLVQNVEASLPALNIQYKDFAAWQKEWMQGDALASEVSYWRNKLQDTSAILEIPTDYPRPPIQTYRGLTREFAVPDGLLKRASAFSAQHGVTLFMTMLTVFEVLLYRYSNQSQFTVGTPIANRTNTDVEALIGFFVNTLVLRADIQAESTFLEVMQKVREACLDAYAHQNVPFEKLVAELNLARDLSKNPLFQFFFILQNTPTSTLDLSNIQVEELSIATETSKFDITLAITQTAQKDILSIQYSTDLFDNTTIERMAEHYLQLADAILENAEQKIIAIPLLTEPEKQQILLEWNNTKTDYPQNTCIYELFEAQAQKTPEAIAVVFENQQLTYQELNQRANQLAHHLQSLGVGPDTLVGICVERSLEMMIGLYGIVKAGGAYVPLDPTYPTERLAFMLEDSGVKVLLTQKKLLAPLQKHGFLRVDTHVLCLDYDWNIISRHATGNLEKKVGPQNLAYMIYTSGSTGRPKGALNSHTGIFNRLVWMQSAYGLTQTDRILQKTPFSFDVSVWELFWPLMYGACLVMARPEGHKDPQYLVETIQQQAITTLHFVPSMLYPFLDTPGVGNCSSLKRVFCSGEALPVDIMLRFFKTLQAELHNLYGPTEAAVDVSYWACRPENGLQSVPIGRPVANTQLYILDGQMQLLPIGVPGELHIGGVQVGKGYLNRPELTAEKFIANPFGDGRLYKTGDLAKYLPDGNIQYLGRLDHQVKIRGFRIELGEIEAAMTEYPAVKAAVAVALSDSAGQKRLVGYMTILNGIETTREEVIAGLRSYLKQKLPEYMVPGILIVLEQMPLSPNGKIDRKALPQPDGNAMARSTVYAPLETEAEQTLASIWTELLGVKQIGKYDNFFELGGDSIVSLQFISRAQARGLYLTPRQVFEVQTIEGLAQTARQQRTIDAEQGPVVGEVALTPIQKHFFEHHPDNPHHFNQSVFIKAGERLEFDILSDSITWLIKHHDALRARFEPVGTSWRQVFTAWQPQDELVQKVNLAGLTREDQDQQVRHVNTTLQASLNITTGPILRAVLFDYGDKQPQKLLFIIHHLVIDFVSWQVLIEDLWRVYEQRKHKKLPKMPEKSSSFRVWSEWLHQQAHQERFEKELGYWLEIRNAPHFSLPVDKPQNRQENRVAYASQVDISLSYAETQALLVDVPGVYHTQINDILLTALVQAFSTWTGEKRLLIDLEGHGRESDQLDLSRTVGWFTSIFPVLLELGDADAGKAIKSIKEQLRRIPQKGMGYGVLRYLNPKTASQLAAMPQAKVCFNYGGLLKTVSVQSLGDDWAKEESLGYLFSINAKIQADQLVLSWEYSRELYQDKTVANLAGAFIKALQGLIAHCQTPQAGGFTPSDFPLSNLSQSELDRLVGQGKGIADVYPLSPIQSEMLFQSLKFPEAGIYFLQTCLQLDGNLDVARFRDAWQTIINRHTILRTGFRWENLAEPIQIVYDQVSLPWQQNDWRALSKSDQHTRFEQLLRDERVIGFEMTQAPLARCILIRMDGDRYQFIWECHHLLLDGWSAQILTRDVFDLYEQVTEPFRPAYPYKDYIAWLEQQDVTQAHSVWQKKLLGLDTPTPLPFQKQPCHVPSNYYGEEKLALSVEQTEKLQNLAQQYRLTLSTLCQSAWGLVLHAYSKNTDIVFGVTVSGRSAPLQQVEARIGPFINTLPLRLQIDPNQNLFNWLESILQEQTTLEQYAYLPFLSWNDRIQEPHKKLIFHSNIRFQSYPLQEFTPKPENKLEVTDIFGFDKWHYPLNLIFIPGLGLQLILQYDSEKFETEKIRILLQKIEHVLSRFVTAKPGDTIRSFVPD